MYKCRRCPFTTESGVELNRHIRDKHDDSSSQYVPSGPLPDPFPDSSMGGALIDVAIDIATSTSDFSGGGGDFGGGGASSDW